MRQIICPECGSDDWYEISDPGWGFLECADCGHRWTGY